MLSRSHVSELHTHTSAAFVEPKRARRVRSLVTIVTFIFRNGVRERALRERRSLWAQVAIAAWRVARSVCVCVCVDTDTDTEILQCCSCAAPPFVYLLFANKNKKLVAVFGRAALLICASLRYSHSVEFQRL